LSSFNLFKLNWYATADANGIITVALAHRGYAYVDFCVKSHLYGQWLDSVDYPPLAIAQRLC